ncbi:MAG: sulfatase [Candidatus Hydrogenedentes bacterium]|nr:sulfatase [Candidatus Hydrogenedentota bacterium]
MSFIPLEPRSCCPTGIRHAALALSLCCAAAFSSSWAGENAAGPTPASSRPNIIWILLDACRPDMTCYGYERETSPHIDALAGSGAVFEQQFTQGAVTIISVPTYMTGRYFPSPCIGEYGSVEEYTHVRLPHPRERLFPEILRANGYTTAMFTQAAVWFSNSDRLPRAFDHFFPIRPKKPPLVSFEEINTAVIQYLDQPRDKPFFLYLHAWDTHFPHFVTPPYDRWVDPAYDTSVMEQSNTYNARRKDGEPFNAADIAYLRALYDGSILYADAQIGVLLDALEARNLRENTLIIIGADHGETLGEDGKTVGHVGGLTFDEIAHVPLVMSGPGVPPGARITQHTENIDIVPTLIELLGIETDAIMDGESLLPVMRGEDVPAPHLYVYTKAAGMHALVSMRSEKFRYEYHIRNETEALFLVPDHPVTRKDVLREYPELAAEMRRILVSQMAPRWHEYERLPHMASFLLIDRIFASQAHRDAVTVRNAPGQHPLNFGLDDGKWLLWQKQLVAAPFSEDVPPAQVRAPMENGVYRVLLEMLSAADYGGHPASSVSLSLPGDAEPRVLTCPAVDDPKGRYVYVDLGQVTIENQRFNAVLDTGASTHWTALKSIVLVSASEAAQAEFDRLFDWETSTQEEISVNIEQLDALGYVDSN